MNKGSYDNPAEQPGSKAIRRRSGWLGSLFLGMALVFVYLINGRELGTYDTISASTLPLNILRGEGVYLDSRRMGDLRSKPALPDYVTISHGRLVTLYPIAPALVELPFFAPQVAVLDLYRPGWDRNRRESMDESRRMAKRAMAVIVALTGVVLHRVLLALGLWRVAVPAVMAACLGSDLWTVGSQAPWQHGPAALSLIVAIALLHPQPVGPLRLPWQGHSRPCSSPVG